MQYKFMTRGFESTDAIRNYIDRRFEKIDRVLTDDDIVSAEVRAERDINTEHGIRGRECTNKKMQYCQFCISNLIFK